MKKALIIGIVLGCTGQMAAQDAGLWKDKPFTEMRNAEDRTLRPDRFRTAELDVEAMRQVLFSAPMESGVDIRSAHTLVPVPDPDGGMDTFRVVEYSMMESALAERYPDMKTFRGVHLHDPFKTIRCEWTVKGFSAIVRSAKGRYHVEPLVRNNQADFIIFHKHDYPAPVEPFSCGTETIGKAEQFSGSRVTGDCTFRSYRLAVAAAGEYSQYFGAESDAEEAIVLSEIVIAINRVNGVYEKDITVRFILIEATTDVFYYDPATDPYSGGACTQLGQNQTTMNDVIGSANYDIGHVFSVGSGGCAGLAVVCSSSNKARGATGLNPPDGDPFYIDYVAHEIGHQFGGNHTQNNSCNRVSHAAREPGSASTIMGYAGICDPDVQNNSDDYFHGYSIQEMNNYITSGNGNSCDVPISFNNTAPVVTPGADYTIPKSTPFMLTAIATDADNDPLTYCWEQWDEEVAAMPPVSTNTEGPMFRSFDPDPSPTRYFPRLSDLVNNTNYDWEELASVSRTMEFRVNVRDFHNGMAGCTDEDDVVVTTTASSGPFVVTSPNTSSIEWLEGAIETVTWNVANTTSAPVSCAEVDILLSYDGGFTYPETLASGVPNDGSHDITVPDGTTATARVMVVCSDNIFFDISNQNFQIEIGIPTFDLTVDPEEQTGCPPELVQYTVSVISVLGFGGQVLLSASGNPPGSTVSFSPNPVVPGNTSTMNINLPGGVSAGSYPITINGSNLGDLKSTLAELHVGIPSLTLIAPEDGAVGLANPTLSWSSLFESGSYNVEVSADIFFDDIVYSGVLVDPSVTLTALEPATIYYWRVSTSNECGTGGWTEVRRFQTTGCTLAYSTDVPKTIPSSGTPTITSVLEITTGGMITDVNVVDLEGTHSWLGNLRFTLTSPEGTEVVLIDQWCVWQDNFNIHLDDEVGPGLPPCPYNNGQTYRPEEDLSAFDGEDAQGTWTLTIEDLAHGNGGALQSWALEMCLGDGCVLVVSNQLDSGLGSLRAAMDCAENEDVITFVPAMLNQTIQLNTPLIAGTDFNILATFSDNIAIDGNSALRVFEINSDASVVIEGLHIIAGTSTDGSAILNNGDLILRDMHIIPGNLSTGNLLQNLGTVSLEGVCQIIE